MKPQHSSSTPGRGGYGPSGSAPRGNPHHFEYRPKGQHDAPAHPQTPPGTEGMDANAPAFKQGGGFSLQPTARPYNGPMSYGPAPPMGQPGMPQQMRGPPGGHHHHQRSMRGPPRGAMHQQYMPRGNMNPGAQGYYPPQMQMPPPYMMGPGQYMGGPPMYGMPPMQEMGMGMGGMPMPMPIPQPQHQPPPKRELKRLEIVDPKTGKPIELGRSASSGRASDASSTSAVEDAKAALASTSTTAQSTPQKKEVTPVKQPPTPQEPKTEAKQNGAAKTVTKSPQESPKKKAPVVETEKTPVQEAPVNGVKEAKTVAAPAPKEVKAPEKAAAPAIAKEVKAPEKTVVKTPVEKTVEKTSETSKTGASTTTTTTTTRTTTTAASTEVSSPKQTKEETKQVSTVQQSKTISPKKKAPAQDAAPTALQQKALEVANEETKTDVVETHETKKEAVDTAPESTIEKTTDVSVVLEKKDGKVTYTLELLVSFREQFKDLPSAATGPDSKWPSMEITSEVAVSRGGSRGGRNGGGAGWERGEKQAGGMGRQGSRGGSGGGGGGGQWARSQDLPKRGRGDRGGRGGGRGGRGGPPDPPLLDGPVKPLTRSDNRWIPSKNASTLEVTKKNVNSVMNKMTREKFDRLAGQLTAINMESLEMLQTVIKIIFDKAVGEPSFCDMYADLCVHLETNWKVWSFLKIVQNDDDKQFYWTAMSDSDSEVVGPFDSASGALDAASGDEFEPVPAPANMKLSEVRVRGHKFIKIWMEEDPKEPRYYWSGQDLDDLGDDQVLNGPFEDHEAASRQAIKTCSFKRILLNACQEEFEKDNIYEELEKSFNKDKEEGKITPQMEADYMEKRMIMKLRMLGNIRFIGELYRKGMLQERIMHECIMKLMDVRVNSDGILVCVHPKNTPDEESIESLVKLLTTMGKDLDRHGAQGFMPSYFHYLANKLAKDKRLSSRITFMIKDVIELRQNKWEPRRKELKQKTLTEIRKEAEREARAPPSSGPSGGGGGRDRGDRGDRGDREHFRGGDRRSNSSRDGFNGGNRSTMAPVYQHSQSMNNRGSSNRQMTLPRGIGARDDSVKTGPSGRPAAFGFGARQGGRGGPSGAPASFPGNRRGPAAAVKKPQSPAPVKVIPPLDEEAHEKIGKKAKSIAEEYVSIVDLKEAETCLAELQKEFKSHEDVNRVFAFEILKEAIDAKAEAREKMVELLEKLTLETKALSFVGIRHAIEKTIELGGDLWCDVPKLHEHLASFIVRFMKDSKLTGVSLDWVLGECLQSVDKDAMEELVDGGFLAAVLGETLKLLKAVDVAKAKKEMSATNVTVLSVFPSYKQAPKDLQEWIEKHGLEEVLPLEPAFGLVERISKASSYEEVVAFIEKKIPEPMRNDPLFSAYACLFILNLSKEGELPSAERCMLLTGFCGNIDTQVRLVSAILQTRTDNEEVKTLLKHLVKEGAVLGPAFSKWLEMKNDNSVSRKRVQEELGQFVEELARAK